jgi:hypothetical protein
MLKHLSFIFLYILTTICYAQENQNYMVSEPYKNFDIDKRYYFNNEEEVLMVKAWDESVIIQRFNAKNLTLISEKRYDEPDLNYDIENVIRVQNKVYFFYSMWTGYESQLEQLYYREINMKTGEFITDAKLLIEVKGKITKSPTSTYRGVQEHFKNRKIPSVKFDILVPTNENEILILYREYRKNKKDVKSWDTLVLNYFDTNLNNISNKKFKMPYSERRMKALNYNTHDNGNLYILTKVFLDDSGVEKKKKRENEANYYLELLTLAKNANDIQKTKIELPNKYINTANLFELSNGNLLCSGYYSNGLHKNLNHSDGVFISKIAPNGTILTNIAYNIPTSIIEQNAKHNDKREFEDIILKEIKENNDGSLLLIAEQSHKWDLQNQGGYNFRYNDIYLTKMDSENQLLWMRKLPKEQKGNSKPGHSYTHKALLGDMSYNYFNIDNAHYFLFLDNLKNKNLTQKDKPKPHTNNHGGYFTYYKVNDASGEVSKKNLFNTDDVDGKYNIEDFSKKRLFKVFENEFIMEVNKKRKEDILIKVEIK